MKKIIILLSIIFITSSCGIINKENGEEKKEKIKISKSFQQPQNDLEKQITKLELSRKNDYETKLNLAKSYLQYGDAYYKEKIFADKALEILNNLKQNFIVEFLKGYAYEIKGNYNKALEQYNKVLTFKNIKKEEKVRALNQKGHIYDLQGDLEKANKYYLEAEKIEPEYKKTLLNRGRYEVRKYNYKKSKKYFEKLLKKTDNKYLKAEIYYDLSLINKALYEIEKAIENAKLGIESNKDYPNNYLALGSLYITKGGDYLDKAPEYLNKAIKLYKNNSIAYKNLGIYYFTKNNFDKAIENFKKQVEYANKDILLMANDKEKTKISGEYDLARSYALKGDIKNSIKYLKKVLNGKNDLYYSWFLIEYINNEGDFHKILNNDLFKKEIKNITILYAKKEQGKK